MNSEEAATIGEYVEMVLSYAIDQEPQQIARDVFGVDVGPDGRVEQQALWDSKFSFHLLKRMQEDFTHFWSKLDKKTKTRWVVCAIHYYDGKKPPALEE